MKKRTAIFLTIALIGTLVLGFVPVGGKITMNPSTGRLSVSTDIALASKPVDKSSSEAKVPAVHKYIPPATNPVSNPPSSPVELNLQVNASSDDAWVIYNGTDWVLDTSGGFAGVGFHSWTRYEQGCGLRFTDVTVPQGSNITSANFTITANRDRANVVVRSNITGEDTNDSAAFSTYSNYNSRNHTSALVNWENISSWTTDSEYDSPEIKTIVQEIIDRPGWQSGNNMTIFWDDHGNRSSISNNNERLGYSYDDNSAKATKLCINYIAPNITITNEGGAANITNTTATLNGNLTDDGGGNCTVRIYYGDNDGVTTFGNWDENVTVGTGLSSGIFHKDISSLTSNLTYYYRCYALNVHSSNWADSTSNFTTYPLSYEGSVSIKIGNNTNDAFEVENTGAVTVSSASVHIISYTATYNRWGGFRWTGLDIPKGSTILNCSIEVAGHTGYDLWAYLHFENSAMPLAFTTTTNDIQNRPLTNTNVTWETTLLFETYVKSPELKTVLQEVVNNYTIASAVAIFKAVSNGVTWNETYIVSHDSGPDYAARLNVNYTWGSPPTISNAPISYDFGAVSAGTNLTTGLNYFTVTNNGDCSVNISISATNMSGVGEGAIGLNWSYLGTMGTNATVQTFVSLGDGIVLAGKGKSAEPDCGNIFRSTDYGFSWTDLGDFDLTAIFGGDYLEDGIAIMCGEDKDYVYRTADYGLNWTNINMSLTRAALYVVEYLENGTVCMGGENGHIFRSTNYGINWTDLGKIAEPGSLPWIQDIDYTDNGTVLASDRNGYVYHSTDYGANWSGGTTVFNGTLSGRRCTAYLSNNTFVTANSNGNISRSVDGGYNWTDLGIVYADAITAMTYLGNGTVVGGSSSLDGHIVRSTDYGGNWTDLGDVLGNKVRAIAKISDTSVLLSGFSAEVYLSPSCSKWTLSNTATPGSNIYGLKAGLDGEDYTIVVKRDDPNNLCSNLSTNTTQGWGLELYTPISFGDYYEKTGTVTLTVTEAT